MHIDDWYIPFRQDDVILRDALASMTAVQAPQGDIPLMVQLVETPRYLYPGIYKFTEDDVLVFRDAVRLGFISECEGLDEVDFEPYLDWPLRDIRAQINLEKDLLLAYFAIEKKRFPNAIESQRLLDEAGPPSS